MSEEHIYQKENTTAEAPAASAEPMGTVIAMESVKPTITESANSSKEDSVLAAAKKERDSVSSTPGTDDAAEGELTKTSAQEAPKKRVQPNLTDSNDQEKHRIRDFFHFKKDVEDFTKEDWILSRIPEEDLMEYLALEQRKIEMLQNAKEIKEKRIFTTLQILISLAAIVAVVGLLRDNPTVLVNILYITGIVIALWIWRGKHEK